VAQLGARFDGIEEVVGSNPIGSTKSSKFISERHQRVRIKLKTGLKPEMLCRASGASVAGGCPPRAEARG
jgi:hypothetical protein